MIDTPGFHITIEGPDESAKRRIAEVVSSALAEYGAYSFMDSRHGAVAPLVHRDLNGIAVHIHEPIPDEYRHLTPSGQQVLV